MKKSNKLECLSLASFFPVPPLPDICEKGRSLPEWSSGLQYALPADIRQDMRGLSNLLPYLIYSSSAQKKKFYDIDTRYQCYKTFLLNHQRKNKIS